MLLDGRFFPFSLAHCPRVGTVPYSCHGWASLYHHTKSSRGMDAMGQTQHERREKNSVQNPEPICVLRGLIHAPFRAAGQTVTTLGSLDAVVQVHLQPNRTRTGRLCRVIGFLFDLHCANSRAGTACSCGGKLAEAYEIESRLSGDMWSGTAPIKGRH